MNKMLENKVALITGGTSGIGRSTAITFAKAGAKVIICGRNEQEGKEVVKLIEMAGSSGLFIKTDVGEERQVAALIEKIMKNYGSLDIAFNNAGIYEADPLVDASVESYARLFDTNVKGVFLGMKYEIPIMLKKGSGTIINTSSIGGVVGLEGASLYTATKHAVIGLTRSAALEVAKQNIRINAICPGAIDTPLLRKGVGADNPQIMADIASSHPIGRVGDPEEIANVALFLASPAASFITGQYILADGGFTAE